MEGGGMKCDTSGKESKVLTPSHTSLLEKIFPFSNREVSNDQRGGMVKVVGKRW